MKIFEIIDTATNIKKSHKPFDFIKLDREYEGNKDSGESGGYAAGYEDEEDPHLYNKKSHYPSYLENDAYFNYINGIKPYISSNPFFPRVYLINLEKDPSGKIIPSYKMEKLHSIKDFDDESMKGLCRNIFKKLPDTDNKFVPKYAYQKNVLQNIEHALESNNYSNIKNKELIQALKIIKKIKESNPKFQYDTSVNNFMIRATPVGPQLVITDPLWDMGESIQNS